MGLLLNCQSVSVQFGSAPLFANVSFTVNDGERHGLIGPNGAGKSTLIDVLAGRRAPDAGEVAWRKQLRIATVPQMPEFPAGVNVGAVLAEVTGDPATLPATLGQCGFHDASVEAASLSGGWRKRLAIARALAARPELLLLDEPTNHLDLESIAWLEDLLARAPFASVIVTHDRYFLENVATHMAELNRAYPEGIFRVAGNYSRFLERREEYFETQARQRDSLAAKVRREVEWLQRGAKARTRKSQARIATATAMIDALAEMEARARTSTAGIDFSATGRQTKILLEAKGVAKSLGGRALFGGLDLNLKPGLHLGLAGPNGSGKTTLLRVLAGELESDSGTLRRAEGLQVVYFDQHREQLDLDTTLKRALAPGADSVIYRGRVIHVNAWAARFLFRQEQMEQPVHRLSGGERARVVIARLMLQEADLLLLDEPTNDLDIPTLEVLEASLTEFPGALVLVTHDRYLMDRVATAVIGLDGQGGAALYAELAQWESEMAARDRDEAKPKAAPPKPKLQTAVRKLSYIEQREWDGMEERILGAEERVTELQASLQAADPLKMHAVYEELQAAEAEVARLYARWSELEAKQ